MKFSGLFVLLLVVCFDELMGVPANDPYMDRPQQFCGQRLSIELSIICKGRYNEDNRGGHHPKVKRGIVEECCKTPCTRNYLKLNYCAPEPEISIPTTTESDFRKVYPVEYRTYYNILINRVMAYGTAYGP